jgi:hypothetical protein
MAGCNLEQWCWIHEREREYVGYQIQPTVDPKITGTTGQQQRALMYQISADYPESEIQPDRISVDNQAASQGELRLVGPHSYRIEKSGYFPLDGRFDMPQGVGTYTLVRQMVCKPRRIQLNIRDSASDQKFDPDKVLIGAQQVKENDEVKPGDLTLEIHRAGYQSVIESQFMLPVGEEPFVLARKMTSAQVKLEFKLSDAVTGDAIKADRILLNDKATADGSYAQPGRYGLKIIKQAYKTLVKDINIPSVPVYVVAEKLDPSSIAIEWKISGDYPGDEIVPSAVLLDGKSVEMNSKVASGSHNLVIKDPAYQTLNEDIVIPDNIPKYTIERTLVSLPRLIDLTINYDISAPQGLPPYRVTAQKLDTGETLIITGGEKLKPSQYEVTISQEAYNSVNMTKRIFPGVTPFKMEAKLEAKNRIVQAEVEFDIAPPKDLAPHVITFIDLETKIRRAVTTGGGIKPGRYEYVVEKPSYQMAGGNKQIEIVPSEKPFMVKEKMEAEGRQVTLNLEYRGVSVPAKDVIINNEKYVYSNKYRPGRYRLMAKFAEYQDVDQNFEMPPGVGPLVVKLELTRK